jgi:hypothetical protein
VLWGAWAAPGDAGAALRPPTAEGQDWGCGAGLSGVADGAGFGAGVAVAVEGGGLAADVAGVAGVLGVGAGAV